MCVCVYVVTCVLIDWVLMFNINSSVIRTHAYTHTHKLLRLNTDTYTNIRNRSHRKSNHEALQDLVLMLNEVQTGVNQFIGTKGCVSMCYGERKTVCIYMCGYICLCVYNICLYVCACVCVLMFLRCMCMWKCVWFGLFVTVNVYIIPLL